MSLIIWNRGGCRETDREQKMERLQSASIQGTLMVLVSNWNRSGYKETD
jgi:hypothetical protein